MHSKSMWRALLLTGLASLVLGAGAAQAQGEPQTYGEDYAPADPIIPLPLYSTHPEKGGLFTFGEFTFFRQTNPLKSQLVAQRGFQVTVASGRALDPPANEPVLIADLAADDDDNTYDLGVPNGTFLGSGAEALNVSQLQKKNNWQPGVKLGVGWRFEDGSSLTFDAFYINDVHIHASATLAPPGGNIGANGEETFLFSPVFNFNSSYGGPLQKILVPNPEFGLAQNPLLVPALGAVYGIWNGAKIETIEFTQRYDQFQLTYRMPMFETETYRMSGLVGPRMAWIWERFAWRTQDLDTSGNDSPQWEAVYTNLVSNRLYGAHIGCSNECYLGHGFAAKLDLEGALFGDFVKEEAKYELARGGSGPGSKRSQHDILLTPEVEATVGLMWYPFEGVEVHMGYNIMTFFDTASSPVPIDFNYGNLNPHYITGQTRFYDGLDFGVALVF